MTKPSKKVNNSVLDPLIDESVLNETRNFMHSVFSSSGQVPVEMPPIIQLRNEWIMSNNSAAIQYSGLKLQKVQNTKDHLDSPTEAASVNSQQIQRISPIK